MKIIIKNNITGKVTAVDTKKVKRSKRAAERYNKYFGTTREGSHKKDRN